MAAQWQYRERVELEAAAMFAALADDLAQLDYPALARRARAAGDDELRHARLCRSIIDASEPGVPALAARPLTLGAPAWPLPQRALYASVALGCVTESLSCALLLTMRDRATFEPVRAAITAILPDEIEHARIGWGHLAAAAARDDVTWLRAHVAAMRAAAVDHETADLPLAGDLADHGILGRADVDRVVAATWRDVITPGLARFGLAG